MARVDYSDQADAYRRSRTLPAAAIERWRNAVRSVNLPAPSVVLDLGAGPGGFLGPLTAWFDALVIALEPSAAMRDEAQAAGVTEHHSYAAAWAEALPLATATVDVAWLSTVWHQFDDPAKVASELRRVLRPDGHVLLRGFFGDMHLTGFFEHFPGHERVEATFPTTASVTACFEDAGFAVESIHDVREPWTFTVPDWVERVRNLRHTDSGLRPLTDDEIEAGIAAVVARYADEPQPITTEATLRLVVLVAEPSR